MKQLRLVNLFKSRDSHTELDIRNEFLSTRIYIILLIIILSILIEYYSLLINRITVTIRSPSIDTIANTNESSMTCPCSLATVPFKPYLSIKPIFHPICSSDFVSDIWLNTLDMKNNSDARKLQIRFRVLSLFCQLAEQTLASQLRQLVNNHFLSTNLLSQNRFEALVYANINRTIATARSIFAHSLQLAVNTTNFNRLLSADDSFEPPGTSMQFTDQVSAPLSHMSPFFVSCQFSNQSGNITFNQFYTNCVPLQALFHSSFVSFYNESIVKLLNYLSVNISHRPLNLPLIYSSNATIPFILNTLMLDTYLINLSYVSYFNQCNPQRCIFSKRSREKFIDTIVAAIGLIGGMTGILHFFIGHLVRLLRRQTRRSIVNCRTLFIFLRHPSHLWNIFCYSAHSRRNQIISTRVSRVLFIIILIIFICYTSLALTTHSVTIDRPTYEDFMSLDKQYSSTLVCSCSNMIIPYDIFVSFSPKFHPIC